jgi:hypothetical protein
MKKIVKLKEQVAAIQILALRARNFKRAGTETRMYAPTPLKIPNNP